MSNWDDMLEPARQGKLPSMFPKDFVLPMVAPADLGRTAAQFLREPPGKTGIHYVEGPQRYAISDVALTFANALSRSIEVQATPRTKWVEAYQKLGFSEAAARSYARMTAVTLDGAAMPDDPLRGSVTLQQYVTDLVNNAHSGL